MRQRLQFLFGAIALIVHCTELRGPLQLYILVGNHFVDGSNAVPSSNDQPFIRTSLID